MNQTPSQRRDLRRAIPQWREYSRAVHNPQARRASVDRLIAWQERRRGNESNAHRSVRWRKDVAKDAIGGLLLFPIAIAIVVALAVFVQLAGGPAP